MKIWPKAPTKNSVENSGDAPAGDCSKKWHRLTKWDARALLEEPVDCFKKWQLNEAMKKAKKRAKLVFELRLFFVECEGGELLSYATYLILRKFFKN